MRIAGTLTCSLVNGEGIRYVIFTQGCAHNCPGCHNPDTWDFDGGAEIDVGDLVADILKHKHIDGITLSGGDPFYQQDECVKLLEQLPGMNVWIYTGFLYEEIKDTRLAKMADVIVDGPFVQELKYEGSYSGSTNQRIIRR
jgi:anaerobic ribonucleoside-triphosphate reductase activating protein